MYTPGNVPSDPKDIPSFLRQELSSLASQVAGAVPSLRLQKLYAVPARLIEGMLVYADGSTWNPGSGPGVYQYRGGAWHHLG